MQRSSMSLRDYLEAASEASKRTRVIIITIAVASVLTFAGFLNSLDNSWMLQRVVKIADPGSNYMPTKFPEIGDVVHREALRKELLTAGVRSYFENTYSIRVPFFGITFDVNDLGLIGGLGFAILLILFRLSLARELDNLTLLFEEAKSDKDLPTFYNLLAMRQVLSTPPLLGKEVSKTFRIIPKVIPVLPTFMLTIILANDIRTYHLGAALSLPHTICLYIMVSAIWTLSLVLTISCLGVWQNIDATWLKYSKEIQQLRPVKLPHPVDQQKAS